MESWPVFLCYRQSDGLPEARIIEQLLRSKVVDIGESGSALSSVRLDVYFDQRAPAVGDWTQVHESYLKRARAMVVVCTPGAVVDEGANDWVHKEINWWLQNRMTTPPILVDALGEGGRWVPTRISRAWPNCQRIRIEAGEWDETPAAEKERILSQLLGGVVQTGKSTYQAELDQEIARRTQLEVAVVKSAKLSKGLGAMLALAIALAAFALWQRQRAVEARRDAERDLRLATVNEAVLQCASKSLGGRSAGLSNLAKAARMRPSPDLREQILRCLSIVGVSDTEETDAARCASPGAIQASPQRSLRSQHGDLLVTWQDKENVEGSELHFRSVKSPEDWKVPVSAWGGVLAIAVHPNRNLVAVSLSGSDLPGGRQVVRLFDVDLRQELSPLRLEEDLRMWSGVPAPGTLRFSPSGRYLGATSQKGRLRVWATASGPTSQGTVAGFGEVPVFDATISSGALAAFDFSPEEDLLAAVSPSGVLDIWSLTRRELLARGPIEGTRAELRWIDSSRLCIGWKHYHVDRPAFRTVDGTEVGGRGVTALAWSHAEDRLAMSGGSHIRLVEAAGAGPSVFLPSSTIIDELAFEADDSKLMSFGIGTQTYDFSSRTSTVGGDDSRDVRTMVTHTKGTRFAAGFRSRRTLSAFSLPSGAELWSSVSPATRVLTASPVVSLDGTRIASDDGMHVQVRDVATGRVMATQSNRENKLIPWRNGFARLDERTLGTEELGSGVATAPLRARPEDDSWSPRRYMTSPDGVMLAETTQSGAINVWNLEARGRPWAIDRAGIPRSDLRVFSPNSAMFAAADGATLAAYSAQTGALLAETTAKVVLLAFVGPEARQIQFVDGDGAVAVFDTVTRKVTVLGRLENWAAPEFPLLSYTTRDGAEVGFAQSGKVTGWSSSTGKKVFDLPIPDFDFVEDAVVTPNGRSMILSRFDSDISVWKADSDEEVMRLETHVDKKVGTIRFSPDGARVGLLRHSDGKALLTVFDVAARRQLFERELDTQHPCLDLGASGVTYACEQSRVVAFNPEGRQVAEHGTGQDHPVAISLAGDGSMLAVVDTASRVRLWELAQPTPFVVLPPSTTERSRVALSKQGRWMAVGDKLGEVQLWNFSEVRRAIRDIEQPGGPSGEE